MNKSIMMGRLVQDPDIRYAQTNNGELAVASFRLAVDRKYVRDGDAKADFFRCTAFGRKAEFVADYLFKGIKVVVEGRMQNDNYTNKDGDKVYGVCLMVDDVDFAESKKASGELREEERQDEGREERRSSGSSSSRSGKSASPERASASEGSRRAASQREGTSRRPERETDAAEYREAGRSTGRNVSGSRSTGSRNHENAASRRSQERSRDLDDRFMDAPDEEMDFD